MQIYITGVFE